MAPADAVGAVAGSAAAENMSLYWPHSPKRTVAPSGLKVRLIPALMNQMSFSLACCLAVARVEPVEGRSHCVRLVLLVLIQAIDEQA